MRTGRRGLKSHSYKKRKSMFSFGDVILPVVGILAVIMLLFAAKVFFFDSLPSSGGNLYVPKVQPEEDIIQAANAQEQEQKQESEAEAGAVAEAEVGRESAENSEPENFIFENSNNTANIEVTAEPINNNNNNQAASQADSKAAAVNNILRPQNDNKQNNSQANNKAVNNSAQYKNNNAQVLWRVQVGAYGSKKAAEEIIAKLAKAGYRATHFAVSKYHKVWVQAGDTKQEAERAAERLKKLGYKGSYVIAPPPVKSQK
ncbi:MAG: SPOR domain-containing protein [Synergistaceae bacterium]|nr:SPOR domain-containing protein [Synergistaceae bacterium]